MKAFPLSALLIAFAGSLACIALLFWKTAPRSVSEGPQISTKPALPVALELDLVALTKNEALPSDTVIAIAYDPFFKSAKTYRAYSLKTLLAPYIQELKIDPQSDAILTFHCTDGYEPVQKLQAVWEGEAYLAFRDESLTDPAQRWPDSVAATFAPFYLVWKTGPDADTKVVWPYGVHQITLRAVDNLYDAIYPENDQLVQGFELYKDQCIKCHSLNRIGGNLGPEFNDPRNVTEYLDVEMMWAYVQDPQSFRYNARMHPIRDLSRSEFDAIIAYLRDLGQQKKLAEK